MQSRIKAEIEDTLIELTSGESRTLSFGEIDAMLDLVLGVGLRKMPE